MSKKEKIGLIVVIAICLSVLVGYYYNVNQGFIPAIKEIEGTFVMSVSDDMDVNYINGVYMTFFEGDYYMYKSDQSPILEFGTYERVESSVFRIDNQSIVNHHNMFYFYSETYGEVIKFIRLHKEPSFINMDPASMPD